MSLQYLFNQVGLIAYQARWLEFLKKIDFEIKYVKGKENKVIHALSMKLNLAFMSICGVDLRDCVIKSLAKDERYLQVMIGLQEKELDKKYEAYQLEHDGVFVF